MSVQNLPFEAFAVLRGMITGLIVVQGEKITSAEAIIDGQSGDLLASANRLMPPVGELPFAAEFPEDENLGKSLRIWLDFIDTIPDEERDGLISMFSVWDTLVLGAFPQEDRAPGESWSGPSMTSYLLPTRLEHAVEDYESGRGAFDLLFRALRRLHKRLPIEEIEIE